MNKHNFYLDGSGFVENVVKIINGSNVNTLCINGDWGSGKSYFCNELKNKLCTGSESPCVISVNCFRGEIYDNPLMSLLEALNNYFVDNSEKNHVSDALMAVAKTIGEIGINVVAKKVLGEDCKDIVDGYKKNKDKENVESKEYRETKNIWDSFGDELLKLSTERKIVFILDELDRCRPDYAIEVMETVKHFFCVSRVKFVYSVCLSSLKKSIIHVYGEIDATLYLEKFFDFQVDIPVMIKHNGMDVARSYRYFCDLIDEIAVTSPEDKIVFNRYIENIGNVGGVKISVFEDFIKKYNVTMRGVERFVRYVDIGRFIVPVPSDKYCLVYYFALLIVVFCREQLDAVMNEYSRTDNSDIAQIISDNVKIDINPDDETGWLLAHLRELSRSSFDGDRMQHIFFDVLRKLSTVR